MQKNKIEILKGLPASGKSTYAKQLEAQGWVRVNKDTIRATMFPDYKRKDEKKVIKQRNIEIVAALESGKDVVVDDTNLNPVHIKEISAIGRKYSTIVKVNDSFLDVPLLECIERDKKREKSIGESAIRENFHRFVKKAPTFLEYDPLLPMAVIVDIDGTLAHMNGKRSPFDWSKVGGDDVDSGVAHLVDAVNHIGYAKVFIFSGRNASCKEETEEWLERNALDYDYLAMRPEDQNELDDRIIKENMLKKYIVDKYNVLFVVDDRPKVCRMWRDVYGLRVLQVGDPYYEF